MWKIMRKVLTIAACCFAVLLAFRFASTKYAAHAHGETVKSTRQPAAQQDQQVQRPCLRSS